MEKVAIAFVEGGEFASLPPMHQILFILFALSVFAAGWFSEKNGEVKRACSIFFHLGIVDLLLCILVNYVLVQ